MRGACTVASRVARFAFERARADVALEMHAMRLFARETSSSTRDACAHVAATRTRGVPTTMSSASASASGFAASANARSARRGMPSVSGACRAYRAPPPGFMGSAFGGRRGGFGDENQALWGLIAANGAVYYAWAVSEDTRFMRKNFMVSEEALARGRYHTMLTSAFSHFDLTHLGMNMIALYFFGKSVCERFGGRYLLTLYCVGGVGASVAHVLWCRQQRRRRVTRYKEGRGNIFDRMDAYVSRFIEERGASRGYYFTPAALGASGAVNAIVAFEVLLYPFRTILLYAILPVPSILLGGLFLLRDIVGIQDSQGSGVAHAGHLGGAAVGALAFASIRTRLRWGRY